MMHTLSSTVLSTNLLYSLLNILYTYFDALFYITFYFCFTNYNLSSSLTYRVGLYLPSWYIPNPPVIHVQKKENFLFGFIP